MYFYVIPATCRVQTPFQRFNFSFVFCIYSGIINACGDSSNVLERKLMYCLNRLGYDIETKVKPSAEPVGHLLLTVA